jgi:acetyl-CoA C-acetyltransferase
MSAAQMIRLGESQIAVAGGAEAMSRAPLSVQSMRFGNRMGDSVVYDWLHNTLADPFGHGAMGCTAENVAAKYGIGRERQDAFSVESHRRAAAAAAEGRFKKQIVGIEIKTRKGMTVFDADEHIRPGTTMDDLAKLKPVFRQGGSVTAGNASGINDGAAAVVLASAQEVDRRGLQPVGRLVGGWPACHRRSWASARCMPFPWRSRVRASRWRRSTSSNLTKPLRCRPCQ